MNSIKRALSRPGRHRVAMVGAIAAGALTLAACGNDGESDKNHGTPGADHGSSNSATAAPGSSGSSGSSAKGAFNDADVTFAQMMIPHHQQAIEMAELSDSRASDKEIKELSAAIEQAQGPEIKTLRGWLEGWGKPASSSMEHSMPGMDHGADGSGMSGIMSDKDMAELKAAKGTDYDKKFARLMTTHHNGAISMAENEQKDGRNASAKKLAGDIIKGQTAEVDRFRKILDRL
ncbi:DUF305 domain-containing protein [Streptomyces sp. NPDC048248]|uniref:DUF305 domain-containing protein n=1 Tax=Streptomyces sp. NPDC048248 TaxID=3365523 RepID=UPI0037180601